MDPGVLYISLHAHPAYLYPGTGFESEVGSGPGRGYTLNIPFLPGATDDDYKTAFEGRVIPAIERYAPQFMLLSVGFDGHTADPLGNLDLTDDAFAWMTQAIVERANNQAGGRILSVLEGGYNLDVLGRCVTEHVRLLAGT